MITTTGKNNLINFFLGLTGQPASYIALGVGSKVAAVGDFSLQIETVRVPIVAITRQPGSDLVVFRGSAEPGSIGTIHEVGLFAETGSVPLGRLLNVVAPDMGTWTNATVSANNSRAGSQTLKIDFVANGTTNAALVGMAEDLSEYEDDARVVLGYHTTSNLSTIRFRFATDASNYFEYTHTPTVVGYNTARFVKSTGTIVGNPSWSSIDQLIIRPSATAAGSGSVYIDVVRLESLYDNMIARYVPATPIALDQDIVTDVEYALNLKFSDVA